jgi:hypothetical protein
LIAGDFALGSQGAEFSHVSFDGALDTLLVKRHQLDAPAVLDPSFGLRQGSADFRLVDFAPIDLELAGLRFIRHLAESEDAGFDGAGAIEAPLVFGDGLGELLLENAERNEGFDDGLAMFLEGFVLFGSEKVDLAGEAVFVRVETGALPAGLGSGPAGSGGAAAWETGRRTWPWPRPLPALHQTSLV